MDIFQTKTLNKSTVLSLTAIYGINFSLAKQICKILGIAPSLVFSSLSLGKKQDLKNFIENNISYGLKLESFNENRKRHLVSIVSFRGVRLVKGLPTRGQRTKTNGQTQKKRPQVQFKLS